MNQSNSQQNSSERSGISRHRKGTEIYNLLFYKLTDGHIYLEFNSCHPTHNKISIPYSQFLGIRRICTEQENFNENSLKLSIYF